MTYLLKKNKDTKAIWLFTSLPCFPDGTVCRCMIIWDLIIYSETDFKNPTMYRKYISDESDFKKIEELYENHAEKDEPFYLFNVTMQNHGGFDKTYSNFHNDIQITDNHKNEQAEQYLSLVKKTDDAFKQLTEYFQK